MRGYPKGLLKKQDYENLLHASEYADRAKADLAAMAKIDDSKVTVDRGTDANPNLVQIDNPLPVWKRAGFRSKDELTNAAANVKPIEQKGEERR